MVSVIWQNFLSGSFLWFRGFFVGKERFVDKHNVDEHEHRSDRHTDVGDVEYGKIDELKLQQIDDIAAK